MCSSDLIEAIEITNFQSHANTVLEFHEGVNVIKGTSGHGKSAIIRALEWLLTNTYYGDAKSWFADKSRSEERRVGKECKSRWAREQLKKDGKIAILPELIYIQ